MPAAHDSQPTHDSTSPLPTGRTTPDETWRTEVALFRYTLILPLLRHDRARDGSKLSLRTAIAAARHTIPHSQRHTVSIPTLRRWEKAYRSGGFEALKPPPRSDRGTARAISTPTLDRAEALKRELPSRSSRTVIDILQRDQATPLPETRLAPRTLRRHLAARGATAARLLKSETVYRRFERSHFGDLWQSDALDGPRLPDPTHPDAQRQTFLFAFLDDHTRLVPHAQFYWTEQLPRLEDCLKRAIMRYGCPLAIYADQGHVYRADQLNTACATLGIQRILARPYSPQAKGKVERFFGFVRSDFLPELATSTSVHSLDDLNQSLLAPDQVGGRLSPQGPLRNRSISARPLSPGHHAFGASRRSADAAHRLPLPRHAPRYQDRHHPLPGQPLHRPRLPGRPDRRTALRSFRPIQPGDLV